MILLVAIIAAFAPGLLDRRIEAHAIFRSVSGLSEGAAILDSGFVVGHVTRVEQQLGQRRFVVTLRLSPDWQPANLDSLGLVVEEPNPLRPSYLAVVAPSSDCPEPAPRDPAIDGPQLRGCGHHPGMIELALTTLNATRATVQQVNGLLEILTPSKKADGKPAGPNAATLVARLDKTMQNVETMSESAKGIVDKAHQQKIDAIIESLAITSKSAGATVSSVNGLIATNAKPVGLAVSDLRYILSLTATQMASITSDLQATAANLREVSAQLRDDPSSVVRSKELSDPKLPGDNK
ncbi:MAG TPA: hypothetical protein VHL34_20085 [Rhizomicrobium sp.]|nr:hypothetical protein [Rhizomicrobium sp.]